MPSSRFSGSLSSPRAEFFVDMGNPFLNRAVDGFLKIGAVGATRAAVEESYYVCKTGSLSKDKFEHSVILGDLFDPDVDSICSSRFDPWESKSLKRIGKGSVDQLFELKKMCKEGAYWGTVAGVYVGLEYGMERIHSRRDWKNAMIGGALTGTLMSAAFNNKKDKVFVDAITGSAVATAVEFLNYLT